MNNRNRLDILEYIALIGAAIGSVVAFVSEKIIYAAVPITLALWLNLLNRYRLEQRNQAKAMAAIKRVRQELAEEIATLKEMPGYQNISKGTEIVELNRLYDMISTLKTQLQNRITQVEKREVNTINPEVLLQLQEQCNNLQESLESIIQYLNSASLPARVDRLEKVFSGLPNEIAQIVQNRINEIKQLRQQNSFFSPASNITPEEDFDTNLPVPPAQNWHCACVLTGHSDWVKSVVISPRSQLMASGSFDGSIKIWQLNIDGLPLAEPIITLADHIKGVYALAISPDGKILVSGSFDGKIKIWQLTNNNEESPAVATALRTLEGHIGSIRAIAISPDGEKIVSGSFDETIKIWQLDTGELINTLNENTGPIYSLAFTPDGQILVSGGGDGIITLWQVATGQIIGTLNSDLDSVWSMVISPHSDILAAGSGTGMIKLWHLNTDNKKSGAIIATKPTLQGHDGPVYAVTISSDGDSLASGSADGTVKIWHLPTGKLLATLKEESSGSVLSVAISPDGGTIAGGSADGTIKIWQQDDVGTNSI